MGSVSAKSSLSKKCKGHNCSLRGKEILSSFIPLLLSLSSPNLILRPASDRKRSLISDNFQKKMGTLLMLKISSNCLTPARYAGEPSFIWLTYTLPSSTSSSLTVIPLMSYEKGWEKPDDFLYSNLSRG